MTLEKVREIAMLLPGAEEREDGFFVEGACFARVTDDQLHTRHDGGWAATPLAGDDIDWPLIEDRVARSWELAAPRRAAGGRGPLNAAPCP